MFDNAESRGWLAALKLRAACYAADFVGRGKEGRHPEQELTCRGTDRFKLGAVALWTVQVSCVVAAC